ncbi:MAG: aldose epimerase family protein [Muribaculaceae bacterium]
MKFSKRIVPSSKGDITIYTLTNACGASIEVSSLGAGIVSAVVPNNKGEMADVVLGYADPTDYLYDGPCAGKVPGRYANRIAKGQFSVGGKKYQLAINNGPNALHGGPEGFQNQIWESEVIGDQVVFTLLSPDGDENYPGNMTVTVKYSWDDECRLCADFEAVCDADTIVNLTNHTYFNLAGENSGTVLDHTLWLAATNYVPTDDTLVPTGAIDAVEGNPMDFTSPKPLGQDIKADFPALVYGKGYDNCWLIDNWDKTVKCIARLACKEAGRVLEVSTDQPAVQIYTGNWLAGSPVSKSGRSYNDYEGVAIECQGVPDAPNKPQFPSQELKAGDKYHRTIIFSFKTDK